MTLTSAICSPITNRFLVASIVLTFATFAGRAAADKPDPRDACSAPAARYAASPTGAALHALAMCHEHQGKTASAWAEYLETATLAQREKRLDLVASAKQHATALEARLSTLAVRVAPGWDLSGLDVRRDGIVLDRAAWGTAAPVDPGEHRVVATAPGKVPWHRTIIVRPVAGAQTVDVGPLEDAVGPVATTTLTGASLTGEPRLVTDHPVELARPGSTQRGLGLVLAGVGLVGVGIGTYFGIRTLDQSDLARRACPTSPCSDRAAVDLNDQAKTGSTISTIGFAAGGGLLLLGSILFFSAPSSSTGFATATAPRPRKPSFDVAATPAFAGFRLGGDF